VRKRRQAGAAKARAKKAAKTAEAAAHQAVEQAAVGEQKLSNQEVIEWVWEHLGEARCPPAPNRKARELWRYAKQNRDGFLDKYVPLLLRAEKNEETAKAEKEQGEEEYKKILDDMLDEMDSEHARDQKVRRLLQRWEPRLVAAENRPEEPMELWVELARIFREPLRPAGGIRAAASPHSQGPVQPPPGTPGSFPAR